MLSTSHDISFRSSAANQDNSRELATQDISLETTEAAIFRLPVEITAEVFRYAKIVSDIKNVDWSWLIITHICKHWREVALSTRDLWTHVDTHLHSSTEQTKAYLERSGTCQLIVHHNCRVESDAALQRLYLALAQLPRISELQILLGAEYPAELKSILSSTPAPELRAFILETYSDKVLDVSLPNFFARQAPKMERISWRVNPGLLSWDDNPTMVWENLKILCIDTNMVSYPLTTLRTFQVLYECCFIEQLWIGSLSNHPEGFALDLDNPILLPELWILEICNGAYTQISNLLKNITLPNIICWNIHCTDYPILRHFEEFEPEGTMLAKTIFPENNWRKCSCLELSVCTDLVEIKADPDGLAYEEETDDLFSIERAVTYSWDEDIFHSQCFTFIKSVIRDEIWSTTKELTVTIKAPEDPLLDEDLSYDDWTQLLQMLPKIQKLTVRRVINLVYSYPDEILKDIHYGLLNALTDTRSDEHGDSHLSCPDLKELCLYGLNLELVAQKLVYSLGSRASHGKRLRRLCLDTPFGLTDEITSSINESGVAEEFEVLFDASSYSEELKE